MDRQKKHITKRNAGRYFSTSAKTSHDFTEESDGGKRTVVKKSNHIPIESASRAVDAPPEEYVLDDEILDTKWNIPKHFQPRDKYPGEAPVSPEKIEKYRVTKKIKLDGVKTKFHSRKLSQKDKALELATKQAAKAELLLQEETGYLEADEGEDTSLITQHEIVRTVDISSAEKHFELYLDKFGPYRVNYTRNGRFLLLGGKRGHVAAIDCHTKRLMCEFNAMESVQDAKWLHTENMFAVAQKKWTFVYDNQGIELHCLKVLDSVLRIEFLPYHFLMVTANAKGFISWLDISIGKQISGTMTHMGRLDVMCQNPYNAVIHLGHTGGTVTLWSPMVKEPLVKMLCHKSALRGIAVDNTGMYMATASVDKTLKVWDARNYKCLQSYKIAAGAGCLCFSHTGLLAASIGNIVEVYKDCCTHSISSPYMMHRLTHPIANIQFCPYEDVLGVGHMKGFESLIIPGAGEANFDALEVNPFRTKKQRQEWEVKALLEKIQPELITLNPHEVGAVDTQEEATKLDPRTKLLTMKPEKSTFEPKFKMKGKSKAGKAEQRKKGRREEEKRESIKESLKLRKEAEEAEKPPEPAGLKSALDIFIKKKS